MAAKSDCFLEQNPKCKSLIFYFTLIIAMVTEIRYNFFLKNGNKHKIS